MYDIILDCYTDEPSGFGAPPYLSVHSRYLAGTLENKERKYYYITIDDLRSANGESLELKNGYNKRVINTTKNKNEILELLENCDNIYVVMGCFVKYEYVSVEPPSFIEVKELLKTYKKKNTVLFYALGGSEMDKDMIDEFIPSDAFDDIYFGNIYNYFYKKEDKFKPNYHLLKDIAIKSSSVLKHIDRPLIVEIETATGCNRKPGCVFCIESVRGLPLTFRKVEDILKEVEELYNNGMRYLRLGRQPNFYSYMDCNPKEIEKLLCGIKSLCPELKMLHIDNVSPHNVPDENGEKITELVVKYCTSGNIAPFGVESFDPKIRSECNLNGTIKNIHDSIKILNKYGAKRGEDGFPMFLPGINIIYGLPGQTEKTLEENLKNFKLILNNDLMVRRVFVRKLTSPYGEQFDKYTEDDLIDFSNWKDKINNEFIVPMLKRVYPMGLKLKELRMEMYKDGDSILRKMATCPVRVVIKDKKLELDNFYNVKVIGYIGNRTILGELI